MKWIYQLNKDGDVYSSMNKAHSALSSLLQIDPDQLLCSRARLLKRGRKNSGVVFSYINGNTITKRPVNVRTNGLPYDEQYENK